MLRLGMVGSNEKSTKGYDSSWLTWRCLNRLRIGFTCSKEQRKTSVYFNVDTTYACGMATESPADMLRCSLLSHHCTLDDILKFNVIGKECAEH